MNTMPELLPAALKMLAALAAVLGGLFVLRHVARRTLQRSGGPSPARLVRVVASQSIGVKKAVTLVEVPGCVLVLGVSSDRVQLLTRLDDPQVLERVHSHTGMETASFLDHLSRFTASTKANEHER
jgi:flagellar protein FliO/FliZ